MMKLFARAFGMLAILTVLTGVVYPLAVTLFAEAFFPERARGSLVVKEGTVVGSRLLGQGFESPKYFWGRLSAGSSTGTNYGPTNAALTKAAEARIEALRAADPKNRAPVPVDLVTASASGLDPHLTPAAALYQVGRVARARAVNEDRVRDLVRTHTEERTFGILGEPRVNVLALNLALDAETDR